MTGRRPDLAWVALAVVAVVLGIWLGVAAADVSPVVTELPAAGRGDR